MSRRNLLLAGVVGILVGCSDQEAEISVPAAPQSAAVASTAVNIEVPSAPVSFSAEGSASVPPPPGSAAAVPRDPSVPIVEGSAQDPNVMPADFVPKAPALQYVKNGQPNLEALSEALQVYCMWKKEVPSELEALVTSKFLPSLPPLPPGKKYGINSRSLTVAIVE